jgi:diguanylate cyclase (GGDEF)-like protein
VFAIDVDRFKRVNDTLGYSAGDSTLRSLAAELISVLRPDDIVGRQGGDEFTIVCPNVLGVAEATMYAERFRSVCAETPVDSPLAGLTLSVGIAVGGPDRVAEDLLREAETALNQAKALGRDRSEMYDDDLRTESERRVTVDQRLREALDSGTIEVHFQPIVEVPTGKIVGAEGLLRLEGADGGDLEPRELVRNAEDSGLIRQIEEQVLDQAAATILSIGDVGGEPIHLSVNVSDQRFNDSRFPLALARALHSFDLPAELLRLEISTNVLRGDTVGARLVSQLRALGVRITLDDFDTPSDSDLISRDAVDVVKLSRDLVRAIHSEKGRAHAEVVISDLRSREVDVCAVGVETPEDLAVIEELGCRYAQGYLFSPPLTGPEFAQLVSADS